LQKDKKRWQTQRIHILLSSNQLKKNALAANSRFDAPQRKAPWAESGRSLGLKMSHLSVAKQTFQESEVIVGSTIVAQQTS